MNTSVRIIITALFSLIFFFTACVDAPKEQQAANNTVTVRLPADPGGLNLLLATTGYTSEITHYIFQPLLAFDPGSLELHPVLAKSRPQVANITEGPWAGGSSYTFEIQEDAVWDNGSPVTAEDYIFTLKIVLNPHLPLGRVRAYFSFLRDVEVDADNPRKFTVITNSPYIISEAVLGNVETFPRYVYDPEGLLEDITIRELIDGADNEQLVAHAKLFESPQYSFDTQTISGSGPYSVEEITEDQQVVLERKANWWANGKQEENHLLEAWPNRIVFKIIPDEAAAISLLKDQKLDVMAAIPNQEFSRMQEDEYIKTHYNIHTPASLSYTLGAFNNKDPKLSDKRVRQALAKMLDLDLMIEKIAYGYAERVIGPIHPSKPYAHKKLQPIAYNPEEAKALLKEAGWSDSNQDGILDKIINGQRVEMNLRVITPANNSLSVNIATLMKDLASAHGIKMDVQVQELSTLLKTYRGRDYDMAVFSRRSLPILDDLKQSWHTSSDRPDGGNSIGFGNARSDALIDGIRVELNEARRDSMYLAIQELIYEEQPVIFFWAPVERIVINKRFEAASSSLRPGYFPGHFRLKNVGLADH
ncbi:MAG: ABC transporter substrate-binding protein [Bacteroidota bacterium]